MCTSHRCSTHHFLIPAQRLHHLILMHVVVIRARGTETGAEEEEDDWNRN